MVARWTPLDELLLLWGAALFDTQGALKFLNQRTPARKTLIQAKAKLRHLQQMHSHAFYKGKPRKQAVKCIVERKMRDFIGLFLLHEEESQLVTQARKDSTL
jgi:hypothetical protein